MNLIALDIGAGSGRAFLGHYDGKKITCKEQLRFENPQHMLKGTLYWDFLKIMEDVKKSIHECSTEAKGDISSIGVDTWGADFGLLDRQGDLLSNPVTYRDKRTDDIARLVYTKVPKEEIYRLNNSVTYDYCTLFQLYYIARFNKGLLRVAEKYLPIPSLINYFLTGIKTVDPSILSGSQLYDINDRTYLFDLLERLRIPIQILPEVSESGTVLGRIDKNLFDDTKPSNRPKVVLVCSHDSASASTGVPLDSGRDDECYINSGTWSLVGMESDKVLVSDKAFEYGFTSWRAFRENILSVKIFNGFYFVQECKKIWDVDVKKIQDYDMFYKILDYEYSTGNVFDLDDKKILAGRQNMLDSLSDYFEKTGQKRLSSKKDIVTSILQSMVLEYKLTIEQLEELHERTFERIFMVGGGSKNRVFCQWLADCLQKEVFTGYPESTINGNMIAQLVALREIKDISQGRELIKYSSDETVYSPSKEGHIDWQELQDKYLKLKKIG